MESDAICPLGPQQKGKGIAPVAQTERRGDAETAGGLPGDSVRSGCFSVTTAAGSQGLIAAGADAETGVRADSSSTGPAGLAKQSRPTGLRPSLDFPGWGRWPACSANDMAPWTPGTLDPRGTLLGSRPGQQDWGDDRSGGDLRFCCLGIAPRRNNDPMEPIEIENSSEAKIEETAAGERSSRARWRPKEILAQLPGTSSGDDKRSRSRAHPSSDGEGTEALTR